MRSCEISKYFFQFRRPIGMRMRLGFDHRARCAWRTGGKEKWRNRGGLVWGFEPRIRRIFTNSALPRDCCSGVSMSARGFSDSAVIDSRYKPAWQRECLSRSRRPCSPLSRSGALFAEDSSCWYDSCSFVEIRGSNQNFRIRDRKGARFGARRPPLQGGALGFLLVSFRAF